MRADERSVRAAAEAVTDPEIGRPLGELGMVGPISTGRGGRVRVQLRLTTETCPLAGELSAAVEKAVAAVGSVTQVDVELVTMSALERVDLADRLARDNRPLTAQLGAGGTTVYAVASGKGGVGKSTVAANLATALAASGKRVGLLDADVWGYSVPQLFGVRRSPIVLGELMLPIPAYGVSLMSIGFFVTEDQPVVWRGPMLHTAMEQFVNDTYWGTLDALFVDLPPGTGDATLSLLELRPDTTLLAVTTPQVTARVGATRVAKMAALYTSSIGTPSYKLRMVSAKIGSGLTSAPKPAHESLIKRLRLFMSKATRWPLSITCNVGAAGACSSLMWARSWLRLSRYST